MGLLLSVLVVCVGVLEVIACVRHFQDGYLPLWAPHCALTSGYTNSYERWRSKPSDSFEFRSSDDVSGSLNYTQDQSSEDYPGTSSCQNGFTPQRQVIEVEEARYSSTDYFDQHSHENGIVSPSSVDVSEKDVYLQNISGIQTSHDADGSEVIEVPKIAAKSVTFNNTISNIPNEDLDAIPNIQLNSDLRRDDLHFKEEKFTSDIEHVRLPDKIGISGLSSEFVSENEVVPTSDLKTHFTTQPSDSHENIDSKKVADIENQVPIIHSEVALQEELQDTSSSIINTCSLEGETSVYILKDQQTSQRDDIEHIEGDVSVPSLDIDVKNVSIPREEIVQDDLKNLSGNLADTFSNETTTQESLAFKLEEDAIAFAFADNLYACTDIAEQSIPDDLRDNTVNFVAPPDDLKATAEESVSSTNLELEIAIGSGQQVEYISDIVDYSSIPCAEFGTDQLTQDNSNSESSKFEQYDVKDIDEERSSTFSPAENSTNYVKFEDSHQLSSVTNFPDARTDGVFSEVQIETTRHIHSDGVSQEIKESADLEIPINADLKSSGALDLHSSETDIYPEDTSESWVEDVGLDEQVVESSSIVNETSPLLGSPQEVIATSEISDNVTILEKSVSEIDQNLQEDAASSVLGESEVYPKDISEIVDLGKDADVLDFSDSVTETSTTPGDLQESVTIEDKFKNEYETIVEDSAIDTHVLDISVGVNETPEASGVDHESAPREEISSASPEITDTPTLFEENPEAEIGDATLHVLDVPEIDHNLKNEEDAGSQHISKVFIEPETPSTILENEKRLLNEGENEDISDSRLGIQTTTTDSVDIRVENTLTTADEAGGITPEPHQTDISDVHSSHSLTSVSPLTIDTSSVSPLEYPSSLSPPKVPSTPKKSKADISWPTFFPGAPVIKRPSVSFATPEAVFTNEDQELLRKYAEESSVAPPCIKKTDEVSTVESDTTSTSEEKSLESTSTSSALEEEPDKIVFREKSPSSIVAGNDFSRKELALQRRKSYKHKRYSSATEIATREEEAEDRSFSENKPSITRASSLKEPKKRFKKPAKSSSFEDVLLSSHTTDQTQLVEEPSIPEGKETERVEEEGTTIGSEDSNRTTTERNEPNRSEIKSENSGDGRGAREEDAGDEDYSLSEEQSSSQQTPASKEAFWLIFSGEYTKAMSKDWHSGHFCCWQCDESLTGQRYVLRDDHPYCIKCYESVFANVCEECNKTIGIDSKDLSYKDKHWHEACFLCNKCRVSLVDKQFGSKADKIYCGNCYDAQFASRCDGCGEIFRAGTKKMEYKTRQWHEKCFCCCVCKTAIGTKSFIPREQEIYCATCYEEKFATRCVKCNKIITSGGVTYKNEPWHRECFTCTHCNTSLAGQRFTSRDEKPYCADCFGELFAKRCTACSKPITGIGGTRFISFEDRHWHNDCFICASCKTSLVGRGFITDADDIICPECAKQKLM